MWQSGPKTRGKPRRPAQPLSQYSKDCVEFLSRVQSVAIVGGTKKEFHLRVDVRTRNDATRIISFDITRSKDDVEARISNACRQHALSSIAGIEPCALCVQLNVLPSAERLFFSTSTTHKILEDRLNLFVAGALVEPTDKEHHCEGQVSVPVAVRHFLLRGVDNVAMLT